MNSSTRVGTRAAGGYPGSSFRRNLGVLAILLAILMATIDASIVNVALPQLSRELHASAADTVWVTTAFLMAVACCIPTTAALGDRFGRHRLFLLGLPVFTLASLACALSPTLALLVAARVAQGVGSALVLAVAIPLYRYLFPPERLGSMLGINAMVVALGTSAGPALGGLILSIASWPWLFLINVPIGAIATVLGALFLPRTEAVPGRFDVLGAVLAAAAIACFLLGTEQIAHSASGWSAVLLLLATAVLVALFILRERRAPRPVLPIPMFTGRFTLAVVTAFWSFFGQGVAFVALPFLFQSVYGATPLESALLFTPWPFVVFLVAPLAGRAADRVSPAVLALVGLIVFAGGLLSLALLPAHPPTWDVLLRTAVTGLGFAIFQSPNNRDMMSAAPMHYAGSAAGVLNLNRTVAQSAGSATVGMAFVLTGAASASLAAHAHAAVSVLYVAAAGAGAAAVFAAVKLRAARASAPPAS